MSNDLDLFTLSTKDASPVPTVWGGTKAVAA